MSEDLIPEKYRGDEELIRQTVEQLKKDFGEWLPDLILSGNRELLFEELAEQVSGALGALRKNNASAYRSLLYRVDVRESDARAAAAHPMLPPDRALAEKVIHREFQKVLTRKYFSGRA